MFALSKTKVIVEPSAVGLVSINFLKQVAIIYYIDYTIEHKYTKKSIAKRYLI